MSLEMDLIIALLIACAVGAAVCIRESRIARRRRLLGRLNSPFFRQVTDAYYRVGNLSGVGK